MQFALILLTLTFLHAAVSFENDTLKTITSEMVDLKLDIIPVVPNPIEISWDDLKLNPVVVTETDESDTNDSFAIDPKDTNLKTVSIPLKRWKRPKQESTRACQFPQPHGTCDFPLANSGATYFYGIVTVGTGTPSQNFLISFDTSSYDMWIPSYNCTNCDATGYEKNKYNFMRSITFRPDGRQVNLDYGYGSISGKLAFDKVTIGGLPITNQGFVMTETETPNWPNYPFDGLIGLGWPKSIHSGVDPVFYNMFNQGLIGVNPVFAFFMNRNPSSSVGGVITFGATDSTYFAGSIHWNPLTAEESWQIRLDGVYVPNNSNTVISFCTGCRTTDSTGDQAAVQTGSSVMTVPHAIFDALHLALGGTFSPQFGTYIFPCSNLGNNHLYKTLYIRLNQYDYMLTPRHYVQPYYPQDQVCISAIVSSDATDSQGRTVWVIGLPFLEVYYSAFDLANKRIGFAPANNIQ